MDYVKWNIKQNELFKCLLLNKEGIGLPLLIEHLKENSIIWKSFYKLLCDNCDTFDKYDSTDCVKVIEYNEKKYLCINYSVFDFIIIDMTNGRSLSMQDFQDTFDKSILLMINSKLKEIDNLFNIEEITNSDVILNFYLKNFNILSQKNRIIWQLKLDDSFVSISICADTLESKIGFHSNAGNVNYLFFNDELMPIGVSNPAGNKEVLRKIGMDARNIILPFEIIPEYVINELKDKENIIIETKLLKK